MEAKRVRKRGRKPKYPIESISDIRDKFKDNDRIVFTSEGENKPQSNEDYQNKQISFGNLNIVVKEKNETNTDDLREIFRKQAKEKKQDSSDSDETDESPSDSDSDVSHQGEYEIKRITKKKVYKQLTHFTDKTEKGDWPATTDKLCWWCCFPFGTIPIPSVYKYDYYANKFYLKGIFCSWECSKAYTFESNIKHINLLYKLYKTWTGEKDFGRIQKAPQRYVLKDFGGYLTIDEFRNNPYETREIFMSENHQMSYVNQDILEVYTILKKKSKKKYSLSRKIPFNTKNTLLEHIQQ